MSALLSAIIPALLPAAADGVRAIINRVTGGAGAKPANVAELIQLMQADTDRLKTLAQLDQVVGQVHPIVADLRALQRPALATLILVAYMAAVFFGDAQQSTLDMLGSYAQMVTFYLFGDRAYHAFAKPGR